jgi:hypothetical protein
MGVSLVMADAGAFLAVSSPCRPVKNVRHRVLDRLGDSVEQAAYFVHGQGDQGEGTGVFGAPFFAASRRTTRNAAAAIDKVMWRYQAWYPRTW